MGVNKVILIGRLTNDPEIKNAGDAKIATFKLAVGRNYTPKGKDKPETDFIPITLWRNDAKFAEQYYTKGSLVYVVGSIENYSYETEHGTAYSYRINCSETGFAGGKKPEENQKSEAAPKTSNKTQSMEDMGFTPMVADFADDLPFNTN